MDAEPDEGSLEETQSWLGVPGIEDDLREAMQDVAAGRVYNEQQARAALGLPPRPAPTTDNQPT